MAVRPLGTVVIRPANPDRQSRTHPEPEDRHP